MDRPELLEFLEDTVRRAGAVLMAHYGRLVSSEIDFKGRRDLLTVADSASEDLILAAIREKYPKDHILAEESVGEDTIEAKSEGFHWIIDPLDGTTNFVHQIPMFAVSIGVVRDGELCAAAVFAPRLDEMFLAAAGQGATLNGAPMHVSGTHELMDALLATGFAYRVGEIAEDNLDHFCHLIPRSRAVRRCGSAAMDLAYTACGRFDGFWELHLSPWDVAAGALLVREAGGRVTDMRGGDDWLFGDSIMAANPGLYPALATELRRP